MRVLRRHDNGRHGPYLVHFNHERNHQGIGNELIEARTDAGVGEIECTERLGGLLTFYRRAA